MKLLNILSILLLVITPTIWAQEQDYNAELVDTVQHVPILVEHAGMATGVVTDVEVIPFKKVQWETSFQYDYSNGSHAVYLPITAIRVGVSHFAEMSIEYAGIFQNAPEQWEYAVQPLTFAAKLRLY